MRTCLAFLLTNVISGTLTECPFGFAEIEERTMCFDDPKLYTSSNGAPIHDEIGWLAAGRKGPLILGDYVMLDDYSSFDSEKQPERVVHATGSGAFGYFKVTNSSFSKYCKADLFKRVGKRTELLARLSVASGGTGTCDTERRGMGMALKFYTDHGNWDLVCCNFPVIAVRDPILVPSFVHATGLHPKTGLANTTTFWDMCSLRPECVHFLMFLMSDRGIPAGYRHSHFYPVNALKVVNKYGKAFYVKFSIRTNQGISNYNNSYAQSICASDYDHARRDLYTSISEGDCPSWTLYYQLMTFEEAKQLKWNPFDATKVWPHGDYPMHEIGTIVLNRNTPNHFAYVEQAAFCPGNMVPGIEPSPDKTMHARLFVYRDAQRYRIGKNHGQLPVNRPKNGAPQNVHRDGNMAFYNQDGKPNYFPNSEGYNTCPEAAWSKWQICDGDVARYNTDNDFNFDQPRNFWLHVLTDDQKDILVSNLCASLSTVGSWLQERCVSMFCNVSECLCKRIADCILLAS